METPTQERDKRETFMSVGPFPLRYHRHVAKSRTMNGSFLMKQCRDRSSIQLLVRELAKHIRFSSALAEFS